MMWVILSVCAVILLYGTLPKVEVVVGDTVIWDDRVWTIVKKRRGKCTLLSYEGDVAEARKGSLIPVDTV